jgi:uroporphyrinogen decarboxylase
MAITERENFLRALEFRGPEWIPVSPAILGAAWLGYREALEDIVLEHPRVFGDREKGETDFDKMQADHQEYERDAWGCLWHNLAPGLIGQSVGHPLADWGALDELRVPDWRERDWETTEADIRSQKEQGILTQGSLGLCLMDTLIALRGFENVMMDLATEPPELSRLLGILLEYNMKQVERWLEIGVDVIHFHSDIGTQRGPMMSPELFRKHIKPTYKALFRTCRDAGARVSYSSDGNLLMIVDDLIECGVSLHDPQFRANTLEGIVKAYKGKMCAMVDLDQQGILPFGTPPQVDAHVRKVVEAMNSPEGGLMVYAEIHPTYPLANISALCDALEAYCLAGNKSNGVSG